MCPVRSATYVPGQKCHLCARLHRVSMPTKPMVQCHDIADTFVANTSLTGGLMPDALEGAPGHEFED